MTVQHIFTGQGKPGAGMEPTPGAHYIDVDTGRHWVGVSSQGYLSWAETMLLRVTSAVPTFPPEYPEIAMVEGAVPEVYMAISNGEGGYAWHRLAMYADIA